MADRDAMRAILYRLNSGCAWKAIPREIGVPSTVYDRFRLWRAAGVFDAMWQRGILPAAAYTRVLSPAEPHRSDRPNERGNRQ